MQRCGTLLGARDYSSRRLKEKLEDAGYPPSIIAECLEKLMEAHYLDDRRYAQAYVRAHLQDRSLLRIRRGLMERGIEEEYIEEALEAVGAETDPEEAQLGQIRRYLQKRCYDPVQADYAHRQKAMAALHRRGYAPELIRRAMEES